MRHAPLEQDHLKREIAENVSSRPPNGFEGALGVRIEDKRQGPPSPARSPSLQKLCGSRFGWAAGKDAGGGPGAL